MITEHFAIIIIIIKLKYFSYVGGITVCVTQSTETGRNENISNMYEVKCYQQHE